MTFSRSLVHAQADEGWCSCGCAELALLGQASRHAPHTSKVGSAPESTAMQEFSDWGVGSFTIG